MSDRRDPIQREARESRDLYDISTWERRSIVDTIATGLYRLGVAGAKAFVIGLAFLFLAAQFVLGGLGAVADPFVGVLVVLSVVPALALALYVWRADVTTGEPLSSLVVTFLLAVLFATFAAVINSFGMGIFGALPAVIGMPLFFFLVVGPIEETVKLLAVRLYAYRDQRFDAVIDGAVYGAVAGLGFATIENAIYITRGLESGLVGLEVIGTAGPIAVTRALAGPGHVIYSAVAGFYLGLAKFNPENAGPIVIKGVFIAAIFHGTYNTLAGFVPSLLVAAATWITPPIALIGFIVIYDGAIGYFLYRKIATYRHAYEDVGVTRADRDDEPAPELTEFDP